MIQDERASVLQRSFALIALAFGLVAAVSLIAARPVFEIFTPSDPYTAYVGLLGNTVSLGFLLPMIGAFFALLAMPILAVWFILLARTFLRLGRQS